MVSPMIQSAAPELSFMTPKVSAHIPTFYLWFMQWLRLLTLPLPSWHKLSPGPLVSLLQSGDEKQMVHSSWAGTVHKVEFQCH